ncbi:hypothetical protein D2A33_00625 [Candidatus Sulcia muelleri]|uniref:Uncharacterized protein n=1 Tax=Candidatus Karelsulcia muelleri TaxID=336810 RepID=A0A3A1MLJ0_9FLAO|nr:hypothetical protein D2A33_00625 [Candidatus Karelsulcia muelleri]
MNSFKTKFIHVIYCYLMQTPNSFNKLLTIKNHWEICNIWKKYRRKGLKQLLLEFLKKERLVLGLWYIRNV